jgi:hypothetical protein
MMSVTTALLDIPPHNLLLLGPYQFYLRLMKWRNTLQLFMCLNMCVVVIVQYITNALRSI